VPAPPWHRASQAIRSVADRVISREPADVKPDAVPEPTPACLREWDGRETSGPVVVFSDLGHGDSIRAAWFVPWIRERCGGVIYLAVRPMHWLSCVAGVDRVATDVSRLPRDVPNIGLYRSLQYVNPTPETLPRPPYLTADPVKMAAWREGLSHLPRPLVGIVWATGHEHANPDRLRSRDIPLSMLRPLLAAPGTFVSLQVPPPAADRALMDELGIHDVSANLADFADTAALIQCLDLTITVDTAAAHAAGALGAPVWVLSPQPSDWQWSTGKASVWYPHARLFRQPRVGDWRSVVEAVREAMARVA
jgi:hypothetical protein